MGRAQEVARALVTPGVVRGRLGCAARAGLPASLNLLGISAMPHRTFRVVGPGHPGENTASGVGSERFVHGLALCPLYGKPREKGKEIFSASESNLYSIDQGL